MTSSLKVRVRLSSPRWVLRLLCGTPTVCRRFNARPPALFCVGRIAVDLGLDLYRNFRSLITLMLGICTLGPQAYISFVDGRPGSMFRRRPSFFYTRTHIANVVMELPWQYENLLTVGIDWNGQVMEESAKTVAKTSDDEDYSQLFEEDNHHTLSLDYDSSRGAAAIAKVRHTDRISNAYSVVSAASCEMRRDAKFRAAAKKVHTVQAVIKTFSNSQQMREAIYEDWLARKLTALQKSERLKLEERMKNEAALKQKATARADRSKTMLQQWHKQKESELIEKQKHLTEQAKQKQQEAADENERKRRDSGVMFSQWKKQKTQLLIEEHRQRKRKEEKAKQEKEAEAKEKDELSRKVIQSWNHHKDEAIKENAKRVRKEKKEKQKEETAQKMMRAEESDRVCKAWLSKKAQGKEVRMRSRPDPKLAWCPARTLHTVPRHRLTRIQSSRRQSFSSQQTREEDIYSLDSFSGAAEDVSKPGSETDLTPDSSINCTGTVKTVKVCCKTLKYFCSCDK